MISPYKKIHKSFLIMFSIVYLVVTFCFSEPIFAKGKIILDEFTLDQQNKIKTAFNTQTSFNLEEIDFLIKWIQKNLAIDRVQVWENSSDDFEIRIIKRELLTDINWRGNVSINNLDLNRFLNIELGEVLNEEALASGGNRILQAYQELGYLNTSIEFEQRKNPDGNISLFGNIQEGPLAKIKKINIFTEDKFLNINLLRQVKSFLNEPANQESLERLTRKIREYLLSNKYFRTEISSPRMTLNDSATDAQVEYQLGHASSYTFLFEGNQLRSQNQLMSDLDLENYYSASSNIGSDLAQKIKQSYLALGFARVDVKFSEKEFANQKQITFTIQEGPKVKIQSWQITGKFSRTESELMSILSKNFSPLLKKGFYSREDVENTVNLFKTELQNQGYLLCKIVSVRTPYNPEKNRVSIQVNIEEGPQTQIRSIRFMGNVRIPTQQLILVSNLQSTGPLRLIDLDKSVKLLKDFYKNSGFLEMRITNENTDLVSYSNENKEAEVTFQIFEGPLVRISSVIIEGNTFTKNSVIEKELDFIVGDILTPQMLEDATLRLQRTGYFSSVQIKTLEEGTAVENRTIIIKLSEANPGLFTMGFGMTDERKFTIRGYMGVAYRNLYGTGRGLSFRVEGNYNVADVKYPEYKATVGFLEPYIFNSRNRGRVNITRSRQVFDYDARLATETIQTTFSLERDFTPHMTGIWDVYSLSSSRDYGIDNQVQEVLLDIATTGISLDLDYRNSPSNPTSGTLTKLNAEYGTPELRSTETIEFWKTSFSITQYTSFFKNFITWANQFRAGYLQNLSHHSNGGVPYEKKGFILGGRSTIRGFEAGTEEVFPNRKDLGIGEKETFILKETAQMGLFKSEVTFPISGDFSGSFFYDGGTVTLSEKVFQDNYRDSIGFGFKYNTPVGPLVLEFGWKLDRKSGEDAGRYHLGFGTF